MSDRLDVLLYAPDPVTAELVGRPLAPRGHRLRVVPDAAALRAEVERDPPRVALVPARLPVDEGDVEALVRWLRVERGCAAVVIGLPGRDRERAAAARADGFLAIPFSDADVLSVLGASTRDRRLILLADDSPLIHRHTVPILTEAGYDVLSAMDGVEALEKIRQERPDLVITDVEMPHLDGYALCKAVKSSPESAHLPVLICSALGEAADLERGFDAGADDYLVKPVLPEELTTRVRHMFAGQIPGSRERILVVDDSPAQRHYVEDCLLRQGFDVVTAENGRLGLEKARTLAPDLIVSDYDMPEMTGFEMVHALKRDPATRDIPVVMLTARDSRRDVAQMRAAGATAYLVKPFAQDKCIATVERTLAERRLLRYKQASRVYISEGAARAAEERAARGDLTLVRAEERVLSVLFSDLVGFTPMSSEMAPREVIDLLNDFFDLQCPIVLAEGGDIDKFIGDAIMAVFDQIPGREPPPLRAVRAALAMQRAMVEFNRGRSRPIAMRVGINTGPVVRGDLGSRYFRRDYTVIGDTVNRANRYENRCPPGSVLISQSTYEAVRDLAECEPIEGLSLKGVSEPVCAYVVRALRPQVEEPA